MSEMVLLNNVKNGAL